MKKIGFGGLCVALIMFCMVFSANAVVVDTTWTGVFTSDHVSGGAGTPPFGEVVLTQNGANVDFTVHLYNDSGFVRTGAGDFFDFKFNAIGITLADIQETGLTTGTGDFNGDSGGMFHYGVYFDGQGTGGGENIRYGDIVFTVLNSTINDFVGSAAVALNGTGQIFVADIISGQTGLTGLVDVSGRTTVPEPGTLLLLGAGLLGLAGVGARKKFRK